MSESTETLEQARARADAAEAKLRSVGQRVRDVVVKAKQAEVDRQEAVSRLERAKAKLMEMDAKEKRVKSVFDMSTRMMSQLKALRATQRVQELQLARATAVARKVSAVRYMIGATKGDLSQALIMTNFIQAVHEELDEDRAERDAALLAKAKSAAASRGAGAQGSPGMAKRDRAGSAASASNSPSTDKAARSGDSKSTAVASVELDAMTAQLSKANQRVSEVEGENRALLDQIAALQGKLRASKEEGAAQPRRKKRTRRRKKKRAPLVPLARLEALYDFTPPEGDASQVAIAAGDVFVLLHRTSDDWWKARHNGAVGFVPVSYVKESPLQGDEEDEDGSEAVADGGAGGDGSQTAGASGGGGEAKEAADTNSPTASSGGNSKGSKPRSAKPKKSRPSSKSGRRKPGNRTPGEGSTGPSPATAQSSETTASPADSPASIAANAEAEAEGKSSTKPKPKPKPKPNPKPKSKASPSGGSTPSAKAKEDNASPKGDTSPPPVDSSIGKMRSVDSAVSNWIGSDDAATSGGGISAPINMAPDRQGMSRSKSPSSGSGDGSHISAYVPPKELQLDRRQAMDVLQVTVLEARNLRTPGYKRKALEYRCAVQVGLTKRTTKCVRNRFTQPCQWNESFKFALAEPVEDVVVVLRLMVDVGKKEVSELELGKLKAPMDEMESQTDLTKWYPILDASSDVRGIIQVNFALQAHESKVAAVVPTTQLMETSVSRNVASVYEKREDNLEFVHIDEDEDDDELDAIQKAANRSNPDLDFIVQQVWEGHPLDVHWANVRDQTMLHLIAQHGDVKLLDHILTHGAKLDHTDRKGCNVVHYAARAGHVEAVELLLKKAPVFGCKELHVMRDHKGNSPFDLAAINGHVPVLEVLLKQRDVDVDAKDLSSSTALHKACYAGQVESTRFLISHGSFLNAEDSDGNSPFLLACVQQHVDLIKLLRQSGADVTATNALGDSALWAVIQSGNRSLLLSLLEDDKLDLNSRMGKYRYTLLMRCLLQLEHRICEQVVGLLIMKGADVNAVNQMGQTALFFACAMGRPSSVQFLVGACGAKVDVRDKVGNTALHFAFERVVADTLIEAGADIAVANEQGNTPLHAAFAFGSPDVVQLLQSKGADNSVRNGNGNIPSDCVFSPEKRILLPFYPEDEVYKEGGGLLIARVSQE